MGLADLVPPVASPQGDDGKLGRDDVSVHLLGALNIQTDVSIVISDGNKHLEPGLLLHRHNLQSLILEGCP